MTTARRLLALLLASVLVFAAACGGDDDDSAADTDSGGAEGASVDDALRVPDDYDTIQAAVDAAEPGDLILVGPGTYEEAVNVETDELTIRGLDRNEVILDGGFEKDNGIRVVGANGVAIENMTARNYTNNGFFWTGVDGYRGSYLTTYRIGDYGIYAFDSTSGLLEQSYTSGSPDAGVYIGQCFPCDAVIDGIVSEFNGLGYSGTNSGGNLVIVNSTFRYNRAGIVPNSGSYELCYPERDTTIVGNTVYSNNQADTPAIDVALLAMGNGILPAGGVGNTIERNLVYDHDRTGIGLVPFPEEDANDDIPPPEDDERPCSETHLRGPGRPRHAARPARVEPPGQPGRRQRRVRLAAGRHRRGLARGRLRTRQLLRRQHLRHQRPARRRGPGPLRGGGERRRLDGRRHRPRGPDDRGAAAAGRLQDDAGARRAGEHARGRQRPGAARHRRPARDRPRRHRGAGTSRVTGAGTPTRRVARQ